MNRRGLVIGGAAVAALMAGTGAALWQQRRNTAAPGSTLWPLRFEKPGGGELAMQTFRGRPLLVNFWATWCPPCVGELPLLDRFAREQDAGRWQVVGLAVDRIEPVRDFLVRHPVTFPIGLAGLEGVGLARTLGNSTGALPFSLVFDSAGVAVQHKLGTIAASDLSAWVNSVR